MRELAAAQPEWGSPAVAIIIERNSPATRETPKPDWTTHKRVTTQTQGRFTSPDPLMASATVANPQTWNRYGYVVNNPLKFIDPSGMIMGKRKDGEPGDISVYEGSIGNWMGSEPGQQQEQQNPTPYVGDGILSPGEVAADEPLISQNPINMWVTIAQEPHIEQNLKLGDKTVTGVGAQLEIVLTDQSGNPLSGSVTESNQQGGIQNPNAVPLTQGYFKDWVGKFGDASTMPGTVADLKAFVTTNPITVTSTQTLTISSGKSSYQAIWTRTLSNVDANGKLKTTFNSHGMNFTIKWTAPVIRQISP